VRSGLLFLFFAATALAAEGAVPLKEVPPMPEGTVLFDHEARFGDRGQQGGYAMKPSKYGVWVDAKTVRPGGSPQGASCVRYNKVPGPSFTGIYTIILGDLSPYRTMTFWIKGAKGGESFEIGMNDTISNKREDAVMAGSIYRYLPGGITPEWQRVTIPLEDFFGTDLKRVYSIVFNFNEDGKGTFWMEGPFFHPEAMVDREQQVVDKGELLLDNFDHSDLNLMGRKANAFKRLPSTCEFSRVERPRRGDHGRSLRIDFRKEATGWCGYYTLLNQIDGAYYDLSSFKEVRFWVRGAEGGEPFEVGMADRSWITIGDSVKITDIDIEVGEPRPSDHAGDEADPAQDRDITVTIGYRVVTGHATVVWAEHNHRYEPCGDHLAAWLSPELVELAEDLGAEFVSYLRGEVAR